MHAIKSFSQSFVLTELEKYQLTLLIEGFPKIDLNREDFDERLLTIIRRCSVYLPQRLGQFLLDFRAQPNDDGAVLIQNLPMDVASEWLLMLLMSSIADLIADQTVFGKKYIQDVVNKFTRSFYSSQQDYVAFFCLRQGSDAHAMVAATSVLQALKKLDAGTVGLLQASRFLPGDLMYPVLDMDIDAMYGEDDETERALTTFRSALNGSMLGCALQAGDMLIFDNQIIGRAIRYDGQGQWLQSISGVRDARRVKSCHQASVGYCHPFALVEKKQEG